MEKVYEADTQRQRVKFGRRLQKAIKSFLSEFLHHMAEEEAIFQPLLDENFDSKELKDMKETVEKQHTFFREKVKTEKSLKALKRKRPGNDKSGELGFTLEDLRFKKTYCQEVNELKEAKARKLSGEEGPSCSTKQSKDSNGEVVAKKSKLAEELKEDSKKTCKINDLPEEILVLIFSHLSPKSLLACGAVNQRWRSVAFSPVFWRALYPTQWARGQWSFDRLAAHDDDLAYFADLPSAASSLASSVESLVSEESEETSANELTVAKNQPPLDENERIYTGIGKHLLPKVGLSVSTLILSASQSLTDHMAYLFLKQVPNVRCVNLSYTLITSEAFNGLFAFNALRKLEELNLTGCSRVGDNLFLHLSRCYASLKKRPSVRSKLKRLILSGCRSLTSACLTYLSVHNLSIQDLDLSGCYKIDGETLTLFVDQCPRLKPEKLAYCNDIEDGPYQDVANGCLNLECETRFCCQRLRN